MNENDTIPKLYTDKEVAEILRISQVSLWRLRRKGEISFARVGKKIVYTPADITEALERGWQGVGSVTMLAGEVEAVKPKDLQSFKGY